MMKKTIIVLSILGLITSACVSSKNARLTKVSLRQQAFDFSLTIVQAYFTQDCDYVYEAMSDTLIVMDGNEPFSKRELKDKLCRSTKKAVKHKGKTYQDYLAAYQVEVKTYDELPEKLKPLLPDYFGPSTTEFYFFGSKPIPEAFKNDKNFIWSELFIFMVRPEGKDWKLKAISG